MWDDFTLYPFQVSLVFKEYTVRITKEKGRKNIKTTEWIKKKLVYTMKYYLAIRKDDILQFTTTYLELNGVVLNERN